MTQSRPSAFRMEAISCGEADVAVQPGLAREVAEPEHMPLHRGGHPQLAVQGGPIEAGEDGDRDDEGPAHPELARGRLGGFRGRPHHGASAGGVDIEHEDAGPRGLAGRARHGIRDVVELEVEEHLGAPLVYRLHRGGPGGGEELRADLVTGDEAVEAIHEGFRLGEALQVQRDD